MVIKPLIIPIFSFNGFTNGARQLVVQEAFDITVCSAFITSSFTPNTTVASISSAPGAEIRTFFAPPSRCNEQSALVLKGKEKRNSLACARSGIAALKGASHAWMLPDLLQTLE